MAEPSAVSATQPGLCGVGSIAVLRPSSPGLGVSRGLDVPVAFVPLVGIEGVLAALGVLAATFALEAPLALLAAAFEPRALDALEAPRLLHGAEMSLRLQEVDVGGLKGDERVTSGLCGRGELLIVACDVGNELSVLVLLGLGSPGICLPRIGRPARRRGCRGPHGIGRLSGIAETIGVDLVVIVVLVPGVIFTPVRRVPRDGVFVLVDQVRACAMRLVAAVGIQLDEG